MRFDYHRWFLSASIVIAMGCNVRADERPSLTATVTTDGAGRPMVELHWQSARTDLTGYELERAELKGQSNRGNYGLIEQAPPGPTGQVCDTLVAEGGRYRYRIRADYIDGTISPYEETAGTIHVPDSKPVTMPSSHPS